MARQPGSLPKVWSTVRQEKDTAGSVSTINSRLTQAIADLSPTVRRTYSEMTVKPAVSILEYFEDSPKEQRKTFRVQSIMR